MKEYSPWEGTQDNLNGYVALGRITFVDPKTRRARVKTIGLKGKTDDLDLYNVQWISMANGTDGSDDTYIPIAGQYGVIIFINSEPYILGYFQPMPESSASAEDPPGKEPLLPGDKIIGTRGGNKIILRSGGSVEIQSTEICRILLLPSRNLLTAICQEMEIEADGGSLYWLRDRTSNATTMTLYAYDNLSPTRAVSLEVGSAESGAVLDLQMGSLDPDTLDIATKLFQLSVQPTGDTALYVTDKAQLSIAATGDTSLTINGKVTIAVTAESGDVSITTAGKIIHTPTGNFEVNSGAVIQNTAATSATYKAPQTAIGDGSTELLKEIADLATAIGQLTALSPLGPCAPLTGAPQWSQVQQHISKIKSITGSF